MVAVSSTTAVHGPSWEGRDWLVALALSDPGLLNTSTRSSPTRVVFRLGARGF